MKMYYKKALMLENTKKLDPVPDVYIDLLDQSEKHRFTYFNTHSDLFKNINKLKVNDKYYVNEIVLNGQKRKPYLDLEKLYPDKKTFLQNYRRIVTKLQSDIIKVFENEYNEYITIDDILLLDSSGKVDNKFKISLHIIVSPLDRTLYYTNSKYSTSSAYHFYTSLLNLDPNYEKILDPQVYNTDVNFRIIGSYKKFSDNRYLKPIDNKSFKPIEMVLNRKLDYLLTYVNKPTKKLTTPLIEQTCKNKKLVIKNNPTKTDYSKYLLSCVKKYHPTAIYHGFYKDVYHNFNYTNRKEKCPISGKIHTGTNGFFVCETERGYYLKCHSNHCQGSIHIGYADPIDDFIDSAYQIDQKYLIMDGDIDKHPIEPVKKYIKEWLDKDSIKTLAVKSIMGSGKTTMIHKILKYDKSIKKILWITHRQTLTKQIYGSFKKYDFVNYLNCDGSLFEHDKVIVQVDSLMRIRKCESDKIIFKQYDLVIIDEVEGCMNHYNSPFLNKPDYSARDIFKFMTECIKMSKKLLILDADFGMRAKLLMDAFNGSIMINNNCKPTQKTFIITNNYQNFNDKIFADIKNNKNVCVISMTASSLEHLETVLITKKIKYVLHTSKTDDKLKDGLEDVNNFWVKYQVVLYSPTIECGVDFNEKHFDKIYCIIKDGPMTCSQRGFLQMVGRIRQIVDPNILCYYKSQEAKINQIIYTYDDVLSYFRYYEELNGKKIIENIAYNTIIKNGQVEMRRLSTNISLYDHISIYNEVETLNKHPTIFMTVLNKLIQKSGHNLIFNIEKLDTKKNNNDEGTTINIGEQLSEIDETMFEIKNLIKKQSRSKLSKIEKLVLQKYFFMKTFGITSSEDKQEFSTFVNKYYYKGCSFKKTENLFNFKNNYDENDIDNVADGKEKVRHKIIIDLLNRLIGKNKNKYEIDELDNIIISNEEYVKAIYDISKNSVYFKNEQKNRSLFFKTKGKLKSINKNNKQHYINSIQSILNIYNINLSRGTRKQNKGTREYNYSLSVDEQTKNILLFKHNIINSVVDYPNIFQK